MNFEDAVKKRRSIRQFKSDPFPSDLIDKALDLALLAPNSSNLQTWNFYWADSPELKKKVIHACLNQSAARTASHLIVATADHQLWKRSLPQLQSWVAKAKAPQVVQMYYKKLVPLLYSTDFFGVLGLIRGLMFSVTGLFRPTMRKPATSRDLEEVAIKSCALACENFVLAITSLGGDTCMMEGFDESRLKSVLALPRTARIVMVIGVGYATDRGTWGPQDRLDRSLVVHKL